MTPHPCRSPFQRFILPRLTMQRISVAICIMTLTACASKVRLDDLPPVEQRSTTGATSTDAGNGQNASNPANNGAQTGQGNTGGQAGQSGVGGSGSSTTIKTVQTAGSDTAQPQSGLLAQRNIYFDYDSFNIREEAKMVLDAHAKHLAGNRTLKIALEGHTDERGGREYNLALGQKRANAVQQALQLLGVQDTQMEAVSFGKEKPKALGTSEGDYAENRRVDIQYK